MSDQRTSNDIFTHQQAAAAGFTTRNILKDDFGFEVPVESVPLPSQGAVYPEGTPLHKAETIDIRAMTAKEEDILTSRALIKKGTVISQLLKSCIVNKNVDVDAMLSGDRNALMIALRITGYGADYNCEVSCPSCGEDNKQDFDLSSLPIKSLEISPIVEGSNVFEFVLPMTKKRVFFKLLTGNDEIEMSQETERRKKKLGMETENSVTTRLLYSIVAIDDVKDKTKISQFVRAMPAGDSRALRKYMDDHEPGIEMKSWMTCSSCGEESEVRLPLGASFFWPDA